jgi:hypothetical protein
MNDIKVFTKGIKAKHKININSKNLPATYVSSLFLNTLIAPKKGIIIEII